VDGSRVEEAPAPLRFDQQVVAPGERVRIDLPVAQLPTHTRVHLPLEVLHGRAPGPRLWLSAAVHGDELNGVEIIRRVLLRLPECLERGSVIAAPIVNVLGFLAQSRYLPDRRDLNRSFPGSPSGSMASRLAHTFLDHVVSNCTHGIDLHTGTLDRSNHPQVRGNLRDGETLRMAEAFAAPIMVESQLRRGSLREIAGRRGIPVLVYEGGEALRFNEDAVRLGVEGVLRVLGALGLGSFEVPAGRPSLLVRRSTWVRARRGGLLRLEVSEGDRVARRQRLGQLSDPLGEDAVELRAPFDGIVLGLTRNPVVHGGDALVHLGRIENVP